MQFSGISNCSECVFLLPEDVFFQNTILLLSAAVIWLLSPPSLSAPFLRTPSKIFFQLHHRVFIEEGQP